MAKFVYRMQNILNIKQKLETQAKMTYSLANQKYLEQQKILQEYMVRRVGYEQHWKKLMQGNLNLQEVEHARADVNAMKTIVRRQMVEVHKAEKELEDARNRLKTVMQERKVQEKLREKAFEEFKQELAEAETKEIDELVSYTYNKGEQGERYGRRKKPCRRGRHGKGKQRTKSKRKEKTGKERKKRKKECQRKRIGTGRR